MTNEMIKATAELAKKSISKADLLAYLQSQMDAFMKEKELFGMDRHSEKKLDALIACKELVEAFVGEPVNLQQDGRVTVGF